mgnify:FL=1
MKHLQAHYLSAAIVVLLIGASALAGVPHFEKRHGAWQFIMNGEPRLLLGGQIENFSMSTPEKLNEFDWGIFTSQNLNTVEIPVFWKQIEPREGEFDFTIIDQLIERSRENGLKLIVLWFGTYKNGASYFVPQWVADNRNRFFNVKMADGSDSKRRVISPFCEAACKADRRAFRKLCRRIEEKDPNHDVVIMVQPENEMGALTPLDGKRDRSAPANEAWKGPVPERLTDYLASHTESLHPWLLEQWNDQGAKTQGNWARIFGADETGQRIFMAWYYARFTERVASAGKPACDLPMYVNDWLGGLNNPSGPSGGPEHFYVDLWRAGAPSIDLLAPDIYKSQFKRYVESWDLARDIPRLMPETSPSSRSGAMCWHAICKHNYVLYAPYNIERRTSRVKESYELLQEMAPVILKHQGTGRMTGFAQDISDCPLSQIGEDENASGGQYLYIPLWGAEGSVVTEYDGADTTGDIKVRYMDQERGESIFRLFCGDRKVDEWRADDPGGWSTQLTKAVRLGHGDTIRIEVARRGHEEGRLDYIRLPGERRVEAENMKPVSQAWDLKLGKYAVHVTPTAPFPTEALRNQKGAGVLPSCGAVLRVGTGEFVVVGTKVEVQLGHSSGAPLRTVHAETGRYLNGKWRPEGPVELENSRGKVTVDCTDRNAEFTCVRLRVE